MKNKSKFIIMLLCVILFCGITPISSNTSIPTGPLSHDQEIGKNQIMLAGIKDENFAAAIYDSFVSSNYYGSEEKNIREIMSEFSGRIIANNKGIANIEGIEWLKGASYINLSNRYDSPDANIKNQITDLTPLSFNYIKEVGNVKSDKEVYQWFRPINRYDGNVLRINLTGNPIKQYSRCAGYLQLEISGELPTIKTNSFNFIKTGGESNELFTKKIDLPVIMKDKSEVYFSKNDGTNLITKIEYSTTNSNAYINYDQLRNRVLEVNNILYSGIIQTTIGLTLKDGIEYWKYYISSGGSESWGLDGISFQYSSSFRSRVYMPVYIEDEVKTDIKVIKSEKNNENRKIGQAKYKLYYGENYKDQDKQNNLVSNQVYVTDDKGEFSINGLEEGEYFLKEVEAPKGYKLNEEKIKFSTMQNVKNLTDVSGGDKNLDINAGSMQEEMDTVYIDRYSDGVKVNISDDEYYHLENIEIEYFDIEENDFKTIKKANDESTFKTGKDVEAWINSNKGNADKLGIIDGKVTIKVSYSTEKELYTYNEIEQEPPLIENEEPRKDKVETGDYSSAYLWLSLISIFGMLIIVKSKKYL